jgi:hypothetical protein
MLRDILAGIAGIVVAVAIVFLAEKLSHTVYPMPVSIDPGDTEELRTYVAAMPLGAFFMLMGGWAVATFVGAVVADRIGTAKAWIFPTVVGGFMFAATTANLILIPHPHWFTALSLLAILVSSWLAWRVAVAIKAARAAS